MSTLASRLKQARRMAGLTQKDLAQRVGVSQPVISQLENGQNLQSLHLPAIAKACGVYFEWLASSEASPELVVLTKEQLADLLRETYRLGWDASGEGYNSEYPTLLTQRDLEYWDLARDEAIQPLVHRSSGGHDDHGREVKQAGDGQDAETYRERPSHHVLRGHESQPCWCWADADHRIGEEVRRKSVLAEEKP